MCLEALAMGASVIGGGLSAFGSLKEGQSAEKTAFANANLLEDQAVQRLVKSAYEADQSTHKFFRIQSNKRAQIGGSGFDIRDFAEVLADDEAEHSMELQAIRYGGLSEARQLQLQARAQRAGGASAASASVFNAIGDVIGGVGRAVTIGMTRSGSGGEERSSGVSADTPFSMK